MKESFILEIDSKSLIAMNRLSESKNHRVYCVNRVHINTVKNKGYHLVATNGLILGVLFIEDNTVDFDKKFTITSSVISLIKATKDKSATIKVSDNEVALKTSIFKKRIDDAFAEYPNWSKVIHEFAKYDDSYANLDLSLATPFIKLFSDLQLGVVIAEHTNKGAIVKSNETNNFIGLIRGMKPVQSGINFEALQC